MKEREHKKYFTGRAKCRAKPYATPSGESCGFVTLSSLFTKTNLEMLQPKEFKAKVADVGAIVHKMKPTEIWRKNENSQRRHQHP